MPDHSPVVTPACAQAIDGSMMLRPSLAAAASSASAAFTLAGVAAGPPRLQRGDLLAARRAGSTVMMLSSPVASGDGSASVNLLTPTTICSPVSIAASRLALRLDQPPLHVARLDGDDGAAHLVDLRQLLARLELELLDLLGDHPRAVEDVVEVEQVGLVGDDLLQPAATTAGPTAAAGRAPRSTPAAARRGRARPSTARPPASRAGCGRRCSPAAARSARAS